MDAMLRVRAAFDPSGLCNPGKIIPLPRGCGEGRAVATASVSDDRVGGPTVREGNAALALRAASDTPSVASTRDQWWEALADRIEEARVANELKRLIVVET